MKWADVSCIVGSLSKSFRASHNSVSIQRRRRFREPKVDVTRDDSQRRFLAQHSVAMLEQCCNHSKQCRNNIATLCCAENGRCESSPVTSPYQNFNHSCTTAEKRGKVMLHNQPFNPLSPNIQIQILHTNVHTFLCRIS